MKPLERNAPPRLDRAREVARRHLAPAFAFGDLRLARRQTEQIGGAVQPAFLVELADRSSRRARRCRTPGARRNGSAARRAAPRRSARRCSAAPPRRAAAPRGCRTPGRLGEHERLRVLRPPLEYHGNDLRDHVAGALQHHGVADADVLAGDLVLVVQRRVLHQHAADIHRLEPRDRRQRAGAADLDADVAAARSSPVRRGTSRRSPSAARGRRSRAGAAAPGRRACRPRHRCRSRDRSVPRRSRAWKAAASASLCSRRDSGLTWNPQSRRRSQIMPVGIGHRLARFALGIGEQRQRPLAR